MPKIIDDLNRKILAEAKKQVFENGYKSMTIRSVATACEIATGTIYNYYSSKEALTAAFMLEDWIPLYQDLNKRCVETQDITEACRIIYEGLLSFDAGYRPLFEQNEAIQTASTTFQGQHSKLRKQLSHMLEGTQQLSNPFIGEFLAEALLAWSSEGKAYSALEPIIQSIVH